MNQILKQDYFANKAMVDRKSADRIDLKVSYQQTRPENEKIRKKAISF